VETTLRSLGREDNPESRHVRSIVDRIAPHVTDLGQIPMDDAARLEVAVRTNAVASARELAISSDLLRELVGVGRVKIAAAVLDLETGVVNFCDESS
jgi:carbonic anhydrase